MIWIGHNNLDWTEGLSAAQREHPEKRLQEMAAQFRENYREPVQSLIDRAKTENHNVSIVVFGLANIEAFFKGRRKAAQISWACPEIVACIWSHRSANTLISVAELHSRSCANLSSPRVPCIF